MSDAVLDEIFVELEHHDERCRECGNPMPSRWQWEQADAAERADLIEDGYVSPRGHGCQVTRRRPRTYTKGERALRDTSVFWARYGEIYRENPSSRFIARQMGVDSRSVQRRVARASRGEL